MPEPKPPVPRSQKPERNTAILGDFLPAEHDMPIETPEAGRPSAPVDRERQPRRKG